MKLLPIDLFFYFYSECTDYNENPNLCLRFQVYLNLFGSSHGYHDIGTYYSSSMASKECLPVESCTQTCPGQGYSKPSYVQAIRKVCP